MSREALLGEVRREMGIPSRDLARRGQRDAVGFATRADQMKEIWRLAESPPEPERLGPAPAAPAWGILCPHDDYVYAGRVYRAIVPALAAPTVIGVGVFHRYRRFGVAGRLVFDPYRAWRAPQGDLPVSTLREAVLAQLASADADRSAAMHDSEHSLEALFYWLFEGRPDREILPILVPEASFERLDELAAGLAEALAQAMRERALALGKDVGIAISADAVHYGRDFGYTPHGEGNSQAHARARAEDVALLLGPLSGALAPDVARELYETFVDPDQPERYRRTWCGRFSVPFGVLLLRHLAERLGLPEPVAHPIAYATSIDAPALPVESLGLGRTAPADLTHFVGYPAVAFAER